MCSAPWCGCGHRSADMAAPLAHTGVTIVRCEVRGRVGSGGHHWPLVAIKARKHDSQINRQLFCGNKTFECLRLKHSVVTDFAMHWKERPKAQNDFALTLPSLRGLSDHRLRPTLAVHSSAAQSLLHSLHSDCTAHWLTDSLTDSLSLSRSWRSAHNCVPASGPQVAAVVRSIARTLADRMAET